MTEDIYEALSRTALLIEMDIFGPARTTAPSSTGCAKRPRGSSPTGRTATRPPGRPRSSPLYAQLAMMGIPYRFGGRILPFPPGDSPREPRIMHHCEGRGVRRALAG